MENNKSVFDTLYEVDVSEHVETKKQDNNTELKYLSWAWAWKEVKEKYPDATYEIKKFKNELTGKITPYLEDETLGYMVLWLSQVRFVLAAVALVQQWFYR